MGDYRTQNKYYLSFMAASIFVCDNLDRLEEQYQNMDDIRGDVSSIQQCNVIQEYDSTSQVVADVSILQDRSLNNSSKEPLRTSIVTIPTSEVSLYSINSFLKMYTSFSNEMSNTNHSGGFEILSVNGSDFNVSGGTREATGHVSYSNEDLFLEDSKLMTRNQNMSDIRASREGMVGVGMSTECLLRERSLDTRVVVRREGGVRRALGRTWSKLGEKLLDGMVKVFGHIV